MSTSAPDPQEVLPLSAWIVDYTALALILGTSFPLVTVAIGSFTPGGLTFWRQLLSLVVLGALALATRRKMPERRLWKFIVIVALLQNVVGAFLVAFSQQYISASLTAIIFATAPLVTALVVFVAFRREEPLGPAKIVGLVVGFCGVFIVIQGGQGFGGANWLGIGAVLLAVLSSAIAFPFLRRFVTGNAGEAGPDPVSVSILQLVVGTAAALPIVLVQGSTHASLSVSSATALALSGLLGTGLALILILRITKRAGATTMASITYVAPVISVVVGVAILGEHVTPLQLAGGAIVLIGVGISQSLFRIPGRGAATTNPNA